MRKLLVLISFIATTTLLSSQSNSSSLYGLWVNLDKELLIIQPNRGKLEVVNDKLYVVRTDTGETYTLKYHIGANTFVVTKPGTEERVWLFERLN